MKKYLLVILAICLGGCGTTRKDISEGMKVGGAASMVNNPLGGVVYMAGVAVGAGADAPDKAKKPDSVAWGEKHGCLVSKELPRKSRVLKDAADKQPHKDLYWTVRKACDQAASMQFEMDPGKLEELKNKYNEPSAPWIMVNYKSPLGLYNLEMKCKRTSYNCVVSFAGQEAGETIDNLHYLREMVYGD